MPKVLLKLVWKNTLPYTNGLNSGKKWMRQRAPAQKVLGAFPRNKLGMLLRFSAGVECLMRMDRLFKNQEQPDLSISNHLVGHFGGQAHIPDVKDASDFR